MFTVAPDPARYRKLRALRDEHQSSYRQYVTGSKTVAALAPSSPTGPATEAAAAICPVNIEMKIAAHRKKTNIVRSVAHCCDANNFRDMRGKCRRETCDVG
jgi:hypothetical protein